jgi:hypothetical protein
VNKKSTNALLCVAIFVGGDYALEYSEAHEPRIEAIAWITGREYDYLLEPRTHVHFEMQTEAAATTIKSIAASGARQFELAHFNFEVREVGPNRYDIYREGRFIYTRSKRELWMDDRFHARYERLLSDLDRDHVATFQIVKGALSQFS